MNQGSNFLGSIEPQSNLGEKVNPSILKDYFSSKTDPSTYTSVAPLLLDWSNKTVPFSFLFSFCLRYYNKLKSCIYYILLVCFLSWKESSCETRKNVFYFTSKALFLFGNIKFENFRNSSFIASSNTK